jgi:hypothetical protein
MESEMTDPDRERETVRDTERTTIIQTDGGRDRGGGGVILAILLILVLLGVLYFLFSGSFNRAADEVGVNVNVEAPKIDVPDVNVPDKIELNVPEKTEVKTDGDGNKAQ